jgi:hypothetical protein
MEVPLMTVNCLADPDGTAMDGPRAGIPIASSAVLLIAVAARQSGRQAAREAR